MKTFKEFLQLNETKYKAIFPLCNDMSPISYIVGDKSRETKEQEALWHYNKSRDHDGLPPLMRLPKGTKFEKING